MATNPIGEARLQIRLYDAAGTGWRALDPARVAPGARCRVTGEEGYGEASFALYGALADFPGLARRRRVEWWALYRSDATGAVVTERLYRGYVREVAPGRDRTRRVVAVTCYGAWSDAAGTPTQQRFANGAGFDRSEIFAELARRWVARGALSGVVVAAEPVGDALTQFDAYDVRFGEAAEALRRDVGQVVSGADADPATGADRLYFRPAEPEGAAAHVLSVPGPRTGRASREEDTSRQATALRILGGPHPYPNLLGQVCATSFEEPVAASETVGNLLANGGFEEDAVGWSYAGGASVKDGTTTEGPGFSGRFLELDGTGETAEQEVVLPDPAVVPGAPYTVFARAKRLSAAGTDPEGRVRVEWRDGSGALVGAAEEFDVTAAGGLRTGSWEPFQWQSTPPTGAVRVYVKLSLPVSGGAGGLGFDSVAVFPTDRSFQRGWGFEQRGTGALVSADYAYPLAHHGAYALAYEVAGATEAGENDIIFQPQQTPEPGQNSLRFDVAGGAEYRVSAWKRRFPGESTSPPFRLGAETYDDQGERLQVEEQSWAADVLTDDYARYSFTFVAEEGARQAAFSLAVKGAGRGLVDAVSFRQSAADPDEVVEADAYAVTLRVSDLYASGDLFDEAEAVGEVTVIEARDEVTTRADAEAYAGPWFARYVPGELRVPVETFGVSETGRGSTASLWPGERVRCVGADGAALTPVALALAEKEVVWDGKLTIVLYLGREPKDPARVLRDLLRRDRARVARDAGGSRAFSTGSGGGGGTGGYATVQEEGAPLAARTTLDVVGEGLTAYDDAVNGKTVLALDAQLNGLALLDTSPGLVAQTDAADFAKREIAAGAGVAVTNGDGAAGDPTVALDLTGGAEGEVLTLVDDGLGGLVPGWGPGTPGAAGPVEVVRTTMTYADLASAAGPLASTVELLHSSASGLSTDQLPDRVPVEVILSWAQFAGPGLTSATAEVGVYPSDPDQFVAATSLLADPTATDAVRVTGLSDVIRGGGVGQVSFTVTCDVPLADLTAGSVTVIVTWLRIE